MREYHVDNLVIGSGPGGAITGALLAEAGRKVMIIEEGRNLALESCLPFTIEEMAQKYRNKGLTVGMGAPKVAYVEGAVSGGGSEINSGLYHRTPPDVLSRWQSEWGVDALEENELEPLFLANEKDVSVQNIPGEIKPALSLRLHEGALSLGWKSLEVPRWFVFDGSFDTHGVPRGIRQSMSKSFLPRFRDAGGTLMSCVRAEHLQQKGGDWAVKAKDHEGVMTIRTPQVFVCGGAVQTPALLRRSGIKQHIGDRLLMHPTVKMVARFPDEINGPDSGVGVHQVKQFSPRISLGCSIATKPYLALAMLDHPQYRHWVDEEWTRMGIYYAMVAGGGSGTIRCLPGQQDPFVRYNVDQDGLRDLAWGLVALGRALLAAGATHLFPSIAGFGEPIRCEADLARIPAALPKDRTQLMTIHLFGSCPMGGENTSSPCDSYGRVKGYPGLTINDGSLLCDAPGVNPQGTIMMLARRNVLHYLNKNNSLQ